MRNPIEFQAANLQLRSRSHYDSRPFGATRIVLPSVNRIQVITTLSVVLIAQARLYAATPANVLLVINDASSLSRNIGEYYGRKRAIPIRNLCRIHASTEETITREEYDKTIESGVRRCLVSLNLVEQILYIVTTSGVPLRISGTDGVSATTAAVDSELTLVYGRLRGQSYPLAGLVPNPFYNKPNATFAHPNFPIYLVTRLTAYDFNDVKALIDRALAARNAGKFIIDATSDRKEGDQWLKEAARQLPADRVVFDDTAKVLSGVSDVIAYASYGSNDWARKIRRLGLKYLPGAIVNEFVSTNGRTFRRPPDLWAGGSWDKPETYFAGSPQSLIADYLDEGATGGSGHVSEPYLQFTPRPQILLPAWYKGRNLAESFYLAIPGLSWQNIVVGDPLCSLRPPDAKQQ